MTKPILSMLRATAAVALAATSLAVQAQSWPSKPVTLIVPYAAGGPTDVIARLVAEKLSADLGQPFVVDNRGGAGGAIGVGATVKAAPDGYTFALTGPGPLAGMPNLMKMTYAQTDYQYVTLVARVPAVIAVGAKSGITSFADLIKQAKAAPGTLNYGSAREWNDPAHRLRVVEAGGRHRHRPRALQGCRARRPGAGRW